MEPASPPDRRTRLAEDRTVLAAERTFVAWLRTGLAFLVSGLAAGRLLGDMLQRWELRLLATVLILCAIVCFGAGLHRDNRIRAHLPDAEIRLLPKLFTAGLVLLLIVVSLPAMMLVWL